MSTSYFEYPRSAIVILVTRDDSSESALFSGGKAQIIPEISPRRAYYLDASGRPMHASLQHRRRNYHTSLQLAEPLGSF